MNERKNDMPDDAFAGKAKRLFDESVANLEIGRAHV